MHLTGNTILITGGGSGLGRGLADAFHAEGNHVIIAGRRGHQLESAVMSNPGMSAALMDVANPDSIRMFAEDAKRRYPRLNVIIHNAGILSPELILSGETGVAEETIATNFLGPIRLNAALLSLIKTQPNPVIMTVSSGLAFVPLYLAPTYSATKAAIHSYTQSLRYQLRDSSMQVIEVIPPYVQTELMNPGQLTDPNAMSIGEFVREVMQILKQSPHLNEVCVERVKHLRFAEARGDYDKLFEERSHAAAARYRFRGNR